MAIRHKLYYPLSSCKTNIINNITNNQYCELCSPYLCDQADEKKEKKVVNERRNMEMKKNI